MVTRSDHDHAPARYDRAFALGIGMNLAFVLIEVGAGVFSGSLALVADAGHNLSDVLSLGISWGAAALGRHQPSARRTYGLRRSSILAALANSLGLVGVVGAVTWEALHRLTEPGDVHSLAMIWVAGLGILINIGSALLFWSGRKHDMNLRAAFQHLASDAGVSLGVVLAGVAILATGWVWLDPVISLLIGFIILVSTWGILRASLDLALDAVPDEIDPQAIWNYLATQPGVVDLHDLHVWAMSTTETALTVHLVVQDDVASEALVARASDGLHDQFGIEHATIQVERANDGFACALTASGV